jgi:hypothetical protein
VGDDAEQLRFDKCLQTMGKAQTTVTEAKLTETLQAQGKLDIAKVKKQIESALSKSTSIGTALGFRIRPHIHKTLLTEAQHILLEA